MTQQEQPSSQDSSNQSTKSELSIKTSKNFQECNPEISERKGSTVDVEENSNDSSKEDEEELTENQKQQTIEKDQERMKDNNPEYASKKDEEDSIPTNPSKRPEVDCKAASRFINHAIPSKPSIKSNEAKRKLEQDEIEARLEDGRIAPKCHLPEIRQVVKGGGWNDEESDSSDDEDLKVFD